MHWLLNNRNKDIPQHKQLNENLLKFGISHSFCDVIPFRTSVEAMGIDLSGIEDVIFPFGSFSLAKALKNGTRGAAVFMSDNINLDVLRKNWGNEMFNADMVVGKLGELEPLSSEFFIRPNEDTKSMNAHVITANDFRLYQRKIKEQGDALYSSLTSDTIIVMSSPKHVEQEYRFVIVDKQVVGQSQYRQNGEPYMNALVDEYVIDYVKAIISGWNPELVYVLDIAVNDSVCKVLEVNGIHASGLYACDTQKFIYAIEQLNL